MRIGVGVLFGEKIEILLRALGVVRAEHERAILDLRRIAPILAVHDGLHALLDESELEIRVGGFFDENRGRIIGMRVGVDASRWSLDMALERASKINCDQTYVPMWGEKMVWKNGKLN